jgi:hypothetical protein
MLPLPSGNLGKVLTVLMDELGMLNKLVAHLLVEVCTSVSELRKILESELYKVETINMVLYTNIKRCGDGSLFLVSADMHETVVVTSVCKLVNE